MRILKDYLTKHRTPKATSKIDIHFCPTQCYSVVKCYCGGWKSRGQFHRCKKYSHNCLQSLCSVFKELYHWSCLHLATIKSAKFDLSVFFILEPTPKLETQVRISLLPLARDIVCHDTQQDMPWNNAPWHDKITWYSVMICIIIRCTITLHNITLCNIDDYVWIEQTLNYI